MVIILLSKFAVFFRLVWQSATHYKFLDVSYLLSFSISVFQCTRFVDGISKGRTISKARNNFVIMQI